MITNHRSASVSDDSTKKMMKSKDVKQMMKGKDISSLYQRRWEIHDGGIMKLVQPYAFVLPSAERRSSIAFCIITSTEKLLL
jgi:hypothetical protein